MKYVKRRFKPHDGRLISIMPHTIQVTDEDTIYPKFKLVCETPKDVIEWCQENFGVLFKEWAYGTGNRKKVVFYFTCKDHAMAFKLRWL